MRWESTIKSIVPCPLIGIVVEPSPRSTNWVVVRGVYVTKRDLFPDIWLVVALSRIIFRDFDNVDEHICFGMLVP